MSEYQNCYVAFLDIMGFKELVRKSSCDEIKSIFQEIEKEYVFRCDGEHVVNVEDFHTYIMSDSICLYICSNIKNSLTYLISMCLSFQYRLLMRDKPILLRGGIAQGDIYFDGTTVFGKGLVDAYVLESNNAVVPRIIILPSTFESFSNCDNDYNVLNNAFVFKDYDGFYTLDTLKMLCGLAVSNNIEQIENVRNYFIKTLNNTVDKSIREKFLYLNNIMEKYYKEVAEWKNNQQQ